MTLDISQYGRSSELRIDSMSRDPKEDLGIKVYSYLNNLADILRDNEFIKLLLREYINLKLMIDKGKIDCKEYILYLWNKFVKYN